MSTRLARKVQQCFDYFPYGFDKPRVFESWIYGPTFAAKVIGLVGAEDLSVWSGLGIYKDKDTSKELQAIMATTDLHDTSIEAKKHSEYCSGRAVVPSVTEKIEIAYPMYDLAKALGVTQFKQSSMVIYGHNQEELVCFFSARYMEDRCFKVKGEV